MCALLHERYLRAELPCARSLQMLLTHLCATVGLIRSPASEDRLDGLYELAATIDGTFGRGEGAALGEAVRRLDGVELLAWLIVDPSVEVQVQALLILGNLCSDACDPNSSTTKRVLLDRGGHRAIILAVQSDDPVVLVYACGCLQNLCHDDAWAHALVAHEVEKRLQELAVHPDTRVSNYAAGALKNMLTRVGKGAELQELSPEAMEAIPALQNPGRTSWALKDIRAALRLKLWDPDQGKLVGWNGV